MNGTEVMRSFNGEAKTPDCDGPDEPMNQTLLAACDQACVAAKRGLIMLIRHLIITALLLTPVSFASGQVYSGVPCDAGGYGAPMMGGGGYGMATGGCGDVLTGIVTGLLCQRLSPWDAARLGTHLHGLAGDLAARERGEVGMIARDLVDYLPAALREF